ncbi:DUF1659 domain-containing protein [Metabacillus sediminilitoris]|uniref:DUF1659 domain-containing protein n=1 Tax=Metabacillus sediminilitoris TaxID=2567941 RepID=A0A4S4C198_9BACI|nr:DUF1659 domain-containing protein [Metabacillus sediminilitoris]QGQ48220.1 DUF1659 domain-containing protein [Metabacillus sediminilitoris]THF81421.1 DUF1659 domain-containing protein [Metabacillus sediminilitoris]
MAVQVLIESQLSLVFDMGLDEKGKVILKRKNYNNIKTSATADQLLQAAQAIASLQTQSLSSIERNDTNQVTS